MQKIVQFLVLVFLIGCSSIKLKETDVSKIENNPEGFKGRTVEENNDVRTRNKEDLFSSKEGVSKIMGFLASDDLQGRDSGSKGIEKAANFIEKHFKSSGVKPYFKTYKDTISNFEKPAYNVVGYLEGIDPSLKNEFIIIGAHYDHLGLISGSEDTIANGANDNASGTTVVMELARYFGVSNSNKRSILFVLFTAEEKGLLGSKYLASKLKSKGLNLYVMLNFEMVGVPLIGKDYLMYVTGYENSNLAEITNSYATENIVGFLPKAKEFNLFKRSDNYPFHQEFNVPSQTFCTFDFTNFDHYHKVGDENNLIDFEHMVRVINTSIPIIEGVLNSNVKEIKY